MNIFYSWQSDLENNYNRNFIKECLEKVIKKINKNLILEEPLRLDQDTKDVPGSPDISNTVFKKIRESDVFVGDVSFIARTDKKKCVPNPNVLIELGYALNSLTDTCIVNLMNTAYGNPNENLPFDLAHKRWPIQYYLSDENKEEKAQVRDALVNELEKAIAPILLLRTPTNDKPLPLKDEPSVANIMKHIMHSNPKSDWHFNAVNFKDTVTYRNDVNLRIEINYNDEGKQCEDFVEPWANCFPDPHATGYWCDIFFGLSRIERTILVGVDGARAMLPIPKEKDENGNRVLVKPFDYKIAEIFDRNESMYSYFQNAGFKIFA